MQALKVEIRGFRGRLATLLAASGPVAVTRHGEIVAYYNLAFPGHPVPSTHSVSPSYTKGTPKPFRDVVRAGFCFGGASNNCRARDGKLSHAGTC